MVDFSPVSLRPCDLLLLRAGQVHAFSKDHSLQGEILTFTSEFLATLAHMPQLGRTMEAILDHGPRAQLSTDSAHHVCRWWKEFAQELGFRDTPLFESRLACSFGLLVHRLAALPEFAFAIEGSFGAKPMLVHALRALLEEHFLQQRDPAWYAHALHLSTRTLDRQLRKTLNQTCKALLRDRLLLEAKRLLADPDLQVKNVAYALGFDEVANFSRFFHHNAGITPRDFKSRLPDWQY